MHVVVCENSIKEYAGNKVVKDDWKSLSIANFRRCLLACQGMGKI
jgi:hypothetical protein